jgi:ketosteroid isomerase-like protein
MEMKAKRMKLIIWFLIVGMSYSIFANPETVWPEQTTKRKISADLRPFLESYFSSWSKRDIEGYKSHFHENAVIVFIENRQVRRLQSLDAFIRDQGNFLSSVTESIREQMTSFTADEDPKAATVSVQWVLTKGVKREKGVDRFTIIRDLRGDWKIVSLVWYINE